MRYSTSQDSHAMNLWVPDVRSLHTCGRGSRLAAGAVEAVELDRIWFTWETTRPGVPPLQGKDAIFLCGPAFPQVANYSNPWAPTARR